jgi:hypothetical protein
MEANLIFSDFFLDLPAVVFVFLSRTVIHLNDILVEAQRQNKNLIFFPQFYLKTGFSEVANLEKIKVFLFSVNNREYQFMVRAVLWLNDPPRRVNQSNVNAPFNGTESADMTEICTKPRVLLAIGILPNDT